VLATGKTMYAVVMRCEPLDVNRVWAIFDSRGEAVEYRARFVGRMAELGLKSPGIRRRKGGVWIEVAKVRVEEISEVGR